jgi:hypothetical protein
VRRQIKAWVEGWLPLLGRGIGTVVAASLLWQTLPDLEAWRAWFGPAPLAQSAVVVLAGAFLVALPFYALGVVGRVAALFMLGLACLDSLMVGLNWSNGLLLCAAFMVTHFGSGRLALWSPEDAFLYQRHGKPKETPRA